MASGEIHEAKLKLPLCAAGYKASVIMSAETFTRLPLTEPAKCWSANLVAQPLVPL